MKTRTASRFLAYLNRNDVIAIPNAMTNEVGQEVLKSVSELETCRKL